MKRIFSLLLAVVMAGTLTTGLFAADEEEVYYVDVLLGPQKLSEWQYDKGNQLKKIDGDHISTTGTSILVEEEEITVGGVAAVVFGTTPLVNREDYTLKREDDGVKVTFTKAFRAETKPGTYTVRIIFENHSAEVRYVLEDVDGYYSAEPPRTKRSS